MEAIRRIVYKNKVLNDDKHSFGLGNADEFPPTFTTREFMPLFHEVRNERSDSADLKSKDKTAASDTLTTLVKLGALRRIYAGRYAVIIHGDKEWAPIAKRFNKKYDQVKRGEA